MQTPRKRESGANRGGREQGCEGDRAWRLGTNRKEQKGGVNRATRVILEIRIRRLVV